VQVHGGVGTGPASRSALEVTMRYPLDTVKTDPEDDDGQGGDESGGCGDGDGCGRQ
jgi:hypothetical protein